MSETTDPAATPLPHRAWTMELKIGADSPEEIVRALEQIAADFERGGLRSSFASGAPDAGWSGETKHDPEMNHERYFAAIDEWRKRERAS